MLETREFAPEVYGVRIGYIGLTRGDTIGKVIEIVRKMFEEGADKWDGDMRWES